MLRIQEQTGVSSRSGYMGLAPREVVDTGLPATRRRHGRLRGSHNSPVHSLVSSSTYVSVCERDVCSYSIVSQERFTTSTASRCIQSCVVTLLGSNRAFCHALSWLKKCMNPVLSCIRRCCRITPQPTHHGPADHGPYHVDDHLGIAAAESHTRGQGASNFLRRPVYQHHQQYHGGATPRVVMAYLLGAVRRTGARLVVWFATTTLVSHRPWSSRGHETRTEMCASRSSGPPRSRWVACPCPTDATVVGARINVHRRSGSGLYLLEQVSVARIGTRAGRIQKHLCSFVLVDERPMDGPSAWSTYKAVM